MHDWKYVELGDLCEPMRGITYGIVKVGDYVPGGVPVIRGGDIRNNRIVFNEAKRVSTEVSNQFKRTILRGGEILINLIAEPGHTAIVPASMAGYNVSRDVAVIPLTDQVNGVYVSYFLRSPEAIDWLTARLQGSVTQKINLGTLRQVPVPVPPRTQQNAIAEVLGALDGKIALNDRIARSCHDLAQAYASRAHEQASLRPLGEIAVITMGSSPPGETYNENNTGMPFYQGTRDFGERFPGRRIWCTKPVRIARKGSTLVSVRAPVGRINIAREDCCIGRGLASLESVCESPSVLFHELATASDIWKPYDSEGTVFGAINKSQMESLKIPSLDATSSFRLEGLIRPLDERVAALFEESQVLVNLWDTLLPTLMSGVVRVREAERIVEDAT